MRTAALGLAVLALAVAAGTIFASAASGASYLHEGYDAGRTGAIPFEGPQTNDTAFQVEVPGTPWGPPVLVDAEVYLATEDAGYGENLTTSALWRIGLADGSVEELVQIPEGAEFFALSPETLVIEAPRDTSAGGTSWDLVGLAIPSGEERWRYQTPSPEEATRSYGFVGLIDDTSLYAPFYENTSSTTGGATGGVLALDVETGEERWTWTRANSEHTLGLADPTEVGGPDRTPVFISIAADEERVYPYLVLETEHGGDLPAEETETNSYRAVYELWGLDASNGDSLWKRNDTARQGVRADTPAGEEQPFDPDYGTHTGGQPVVTEERVYIRLDAFEALNPATGQTVWTSRAGRLDQVKTQGSLSMGVRDGTFLGVSRQTAYGLDAVTGDPLWQRTDTTPNKFYTIRPIQQGPERAYIPTVYGGEGIDHVGIGVEAVDPASGEALWNWRYMPSQGPPSLIPGGFAFGPGVMVQGANDGVVNVVGETEASLGAPEVDDTERYPGVGEEVELDLSDTEPGAFGPATKYRVFWGDNTTTGWQESPTFTHVYEEAGTREARLQVGNEANQTASMFVTMRVGESEPNLLATAFKQENQDLTFGVLGVALALGGGAVGVARRYRKRNRLQEELDALERGFAEMKEIPSECEPFLDNRKARARSLALDGHLDEEQVAIVENRAEELRAELRLDAVEEEFAFLPHGLVVKAREMVEDGEITSLERDGFLTALEDSDVITDEQEALVRRRIEDWFGRDAGGG